ncbi:MAG: glutamine-hydrolyzing GMP synthase [Gammaproteobacteria bacterium]|nr:glutamine-hydrolyzing GMP synthase [Gammaproteobacteria bacterium]
MAIHSQRILILDFGSQYTQLIARRVRELGVYCELHACDWPEKSIENFSPDGIILSGGPESATEHATARIPNIVFDLGCPVLGICYGMQAMALQLGGEVESASHREFGYAKLQLQIQSDLFRQIEDELIYNISYLDVWMSHGDRVVGLPKGFSCIGSTNNAPIAAMADETRHFYGVQFHPEVTHTRQGKRILERFVRDICGCESLWTTDTIIEETVHSLRQKVGSDKVLLGLSGGVDSSVVAALLHRAIGKQLVCVFVDTGLLRKNESEQVVQTFVKHLNMQVIVVNAEERFLSALKGESDPEAKRKIIGKLFVDIFEEEAAKLSQVKWLAQGTIYSDVIESAGDKTGKSHVIKSHHNVAGLPETLKLKLLEPLRELFKDEVQKLGLELGLPYHMLYRHPFPGPGFGVRILGEVRSEYINILRNADAIFMEELYRHQWYQKVSQAFAVFLPIKSVGVMGDARKYEYVIALRAVETTDFMTAHWARLPYDLIDIVSNRIINEVRGVSRVVYDVSGKPPATIEWE